MKKVFLDSRHALGAPCDKTYELPPQCIKCRRSSEHIEIDCHQFQASYTWNSVNATNNHFAFVGSGAPVDVELVVGNYTFEELACTITAALVDGGVLGAEVTYLRPYNKLRFDLPEDMTITFANDSWKILGFAPTDVPTGTEIISTSVIDLSPIDSVWVRLEGVSMMGDGCLANWTGEVKPAAVLFTVPIQPMPFQKLDYVGPADASFAVPLVDREVRSLRIVMCDGSGVPLLDFPDYTLTLRVRVVDTHVSNLDANVAALLQHVQRASELYCAEATSRHMDAALEYLQSSGYSEDEPQVPETTFG